MAWERVRGKQRQRNHERTSELENVEQRMENGLGKREGEKYSSVSR